MLRNFTCTFCAVLLTFAVGCSKPDRRNLEEKAAEAKEKTRTAAQRLQHDARKLAEESKHGAGTLRQDIDRALRSTGSTQGDAVLESDEKVRRGAYDLKTAGGRAAVKIGRAATIAKVKAKLATDVGLSTITGVEVDASGQVVTLRGTVSSQAQKESAEQTVLRVDGVQKVVNELVVKP